MAQMLSAMTTHPVGVGTYLALAIVRTSCKTDQHLTKCRSFRARPFGTFGNMPKVQGNGNKSMITSVSGWLAGPEWNHTDLILSRVPLSRAATFASPKLHASSRTGWRVLFWPPKENQKTSAWLPAFGRMFIQTTTDSTTPHYTSVTDRSIARQTSLIA